MKTTAKRKAKEVMIADCKHSGMGAISTKAYEDFSSRIKSTLAFDEKACEDAMVMLFNTLYGLDPENGIEDCSEMARIAFRMIRPEIEKAMRRSRMARERAQRRKAGKGATTTQKKHPNYMTISKVGAQHIAPANKQSNSEPSASPCGLASDGIAGGDTLSLTGPVEEHANLPRMVSPKAMRCG